MDAALNWPLHGGPDAQGVPQWDFSTNANACGPCPWALQALAQADRHRYPDPAYTRLHTVLAQFHAVPVERVLLAASASEWIYRISACAARQGVGHVVLPAHSYGDYARAAHVWGLQCVPQQHPGPVVHWACEPASPLGGQDPALDAWARQAAVPGSFRVLDCAYAPLRLQDSRLPLFPISPVSPVFSEVWQLWTPNKALGLTGVRAAYVIAPQGMQAQAAALQAMSPSWPIGADGVALLSAWVQPETQHWLAQSLATLQNWKTQQMAVCQTLGWPVLEQGLANYFCAQPSVKELSALLAALRAQGIKLRDCTSFGLPGLVRLGVLPPPAQQALAHSVARLTLGNSHTP